MAFGQFIHRESLTDTILCLSANAQKLYQMGIGNVIDKSTLQIAQQYKHRWKIELFFKQIQQQLKIKSFWGRTENGEKTQIWITTSVDVLVVIAKKKFKLKQCLNEILQVISVCIFDRPPITNMFTNSIQQNFKELDHNQLNIVD